METTSSNLHVSGLTYSPQGAPSVYSQMLIFRETNLSLQPLLGMEWSDAMALSVAVGIPDFVQIYMELMKTASSNLHASGLRHSPQCAPFVYSETLIFREAHRPTSAQPLLGMEWSDAMALSIAVGIPDLAWVNMEPMETAQCSWISTLPDSDFPEGQSQLSNCMAWMGVMPWPFSLL